MKVKFLGHAAFKVTTDKGTRIIFDPYESGSYGGAIGYGKITEEADIVITSHDHGDHNYTKDIKGNFQHIKEEGAFEVKDVKLTEIPTFHDASGGKERGGNLISVLSADGMTLAHMGDIGHDLNSATLKKIGKVDVMLIPIGGFFTVDADAASKIIDAIGPKITIPMHYKTDKCAFPIGTVDDFIKGRNNVILKDKESEIEIKKDTLPSAPEIVVLKCAL
ncbi:MAG: MBL fold metallo-hydrolase [Deltaproteobacteria bacterium]|nr:MBL fold metallo-hydrolase [Deltaproteobacteria bacterium]